MSETVFFNSDKFRNDIDDFSKRKIKSDDIFYIASINKRTAYEFIRKYHYLGDAKFFSKYCFGLFYKPTTDIVGCAVFSLPQGTQATMSWFSLSPSTQNVLELTRLCVLPCLNGTNATSFLLGGSLKEFRKMNNDAKCLAKREGREFKKEDWVCRAVISLALTERHVGSIYQVCNFDYYGISTQKANFYWETGEVDPRGKSSDRHGVWLKKGKKHRYAYIIDKSLKCNYTLQARPTKGDLAHPNDCCNGKKVVYDNRFGEWWTCPRCTGKCELVDENGNKIENPRLVGKQIKRTDKKHVDDAVRFSLDSLL